MKRISLISILLFIFARFLFAQGGIHVVWNPNNESDLAGYNVFIWDESKVSVQPDSISDNYWFYDVDKLKNKPDLHSATIAVGTETHTWNNLIPFGATFRCGVSAFDINGNESMAVTTSIVLTEPPDIISPDIPDGLQLEINIIVKIKTNQ